MNLNIKWNFNSCRTFWYHLICRLIYNEQIFFSCFLVFFNIVVKLLRDYDLNLTKIFSKEELTGKTGFTKVINFLHVECREKFLMKHLCKRKCLHVVMWKLTFCSMKRLQYSVIQKRFLYSFCKCNIYFSIKTWR